MKKTKRLLSLLTALTITASAFASLAIPASAADNSVSISENFDSAAVTGVKTADGSTVGAAYTASGDNYAWNVSCAIPWDSTEHAIDLTENVGNDLLTFTNGVGGVTKDIRFSFDAGTIKTYTQGETIWRVEFKSTDSKVLFALLFKTGLSQRYIQIVTGEDDPVTAYATSLYSDKKYVNSVGYITFNPAGGGHVTFGSVEADFSEGSNLGRITLESYQKADNTSSNPRGDWARGFQVDNVVLQTVDKYETTFNVTSSDSSQSTEGAKLTVGGYTYTVSDEGKATAYLLPGESAYEVVLAKHSAGTGKANVTVAGPNIVNVELEYAGDPVAKRVDISGGDEYVYIPQTGTNSTKNKYVATVYDQTGQVMNDEAVTWTIASDAQGATISEDGIVTIPDTFVVGDYNGIDMTIKATVDSTVPEQEIVQTITPTKTGTAVPIYASYTNGALTKLTVKSEISVTEGTAINIMDAPDNAKVMLWNNIEDMEPMAAPITIEPSPVVEKTVTLHIREAQRLADFTIVAPKVIKDGKTAVVEVTKPLDQYGEPYTGAAQTYTVSSETDNVVAANSDDGMSVTPDTGTSQYVEADITVTSSNNVKNSVTSTVYGYDFYEPGIDAATYADENARIEKIGDRNILVWPDSASSSASTTLTLPDPVSLGAGTAKKITFNNIWTDNTFYTGERSMKFYNSDNKLILDLSFTGALYRYSRKISTNYNKQSNGSYREAYRYGQDYLAPFGGKDTETGALIIIETDNDKLTTVKVKYGSSEVKSFSLYETTEVTADTDAFKYQTGEDESGEPTYAYNTILVDDETQPIEAKDIAKIVLTGGNGAPATRMVSLTDLIISDSDIPDMEIVGGATIAKISGQNATKKYRASVFSKEDGETFTWSVTTDKADDANPVTITQEGVLTVPYNTEATKATIKYESSVSGKKPATKEVEIKDFAEIASFVINGPAAISSGDTATYQATKITDEYGDVIDIPAKYSITAGNTVATINEDTGELTTIADQTGTVTISVTLGNPGKTKTLTKDVNVAKYVYVDKNASGSQEIDVTGLDNYSASAKFLVTTATASGEQVSQTETTATAGKISVDMGEATQLEISPVYELDSVGNISGGKVVPLADGRYDFTFTKADLTRGDIYVNDIMVGQNVDQSGSGGAKLTTSPAYTAPDVLVEGGSANIVMKDSATNMGSIVIKKNPSIVTRKPHLYILGDSLVANYQYSGNKTTATPAAGDAQTGWGEVMNKFINNNITNLAESGNFAKGLYPVAFKSALASAEEGDYILIECGYNDTASKNSNETEMGEYLEMMYDECAEAGVIFIASGPNFSPLRGDTNKASVGYTSKILNVAQSKGFLGISLSGLGQSYYTAKGWDSDYWGKNFNVYYGGSQQDNLHLSYHGATLHASLAAQAIYNAQHDTSNAALAQQLAGLEINTNPVNLTDSEGAALAIQVTPSN